MATTDMRAFTDGATAPQDENESAERSAIRNQIAFGMDMEIFLRSDVGRYLVKRAAEEITHLRQQFETVDASDAKAIRDLQLEIATRRVWQDWIASAIQEGLSAQEIAHERNVL